MQIGTWNVSHAVYMPCFIAAWLVGASGTESSLFWIVDDFLTTKW